MISGAESLHGNTTFCWKTRNHLWIPGTGKSLFSFSRTWRLELTKSRGLGIKWPGYEYDHTFPSDMEVKNELS